MKQQSIQLLTLHLKNIHIEGDLVTMTAEEWLDLETWCIEMGVGSLSLIDILSGTGPLPPSGDTPVTRKFEMRRLRPKVQLVNF